MKAFLDFEASSLGKESYPIEVAWVFEDGTARSFLIRPAPAWTDWDPGAEAVHGIDRRRLLDSGVAHEVVARRLLEAQAGHELFASAPSWDGKWLSTLLRAAGLPRHALRIRSTAEAQSEIASAILAGHAPAEEVPGIAETIAAEARLAGEALPAEHRALADARREYAIWRDTGRRAEVWVSGRFAER